VKSTEVLNNDWGPIAQEQFLNHILANVLSLKT